MAGSRPVVARVHQEEESHADRRFPDPPLAERQDERRIIARSRPIRSTTRWPRWPRPGSMRAVIHPPSSLGEAVNALAVEAVRRHPDKFCILGHFDLQSPDRERHRQALARTAGHARLPLHLQPAASEELVDRRLARLVLGGVRAGRAAGRPAGRRANGRPRQDRRAPSRAEAAHRPPSGAAAAAAGDTTMRPLPICAEMLALAKLPQCRGQAVRRAELFEPALSRTRTSTTICSRSSTRSGPSAASGAPTSPACRARTGNA